MGGGGGLAGPARGGCARKQRDVGGSDVRALHDASAVAQDRLAKRERGTRARGRSVQEKEVWLLVFQTSSSVSDVVTLH